MLKKSLDIEGYLLEFDDDWKPFEPAIDMLVKLTEKINPVCRTLTSIRGMNNSECYKNHINAVKKDLEDFRRIILNTRSIYPQHKEAFSEMENVYQHLKNRIEEL